MTSFSAVQDQLQNYVMTKDDSILIMLLERKKYPKKYDWKYMKMPIAYDYKKLLQQATPA